MTVAAPARPGPLAHPIRARTQGASWTVAVAVIAALVLLPVGAVVFSVVDPATDVWAHLWRTRLPGTLVQTAQLLVLVGAGTLVLGGGLAWITFAYRFPGHRAFAWLLVLPLAMPPYVLGFVFLSVFGFTGPIQGALRDAFGADVWVPDVQSLGGASVVLTLTLYPYVYLLARAALREQTASSYAVARSLGHGPVAAARRVVLPLARPSLAAGLVLVMMETLTDFATLQYFGVRTVSVEVYRVWKGMFDRDAAGELAALVLFVALAVLFVERLLRGRRRYHQRGAGATTIEPARLRGWKAMAATGACSGVLLLAFGAPVGQLLAWTTTDAARSVVTGFDARFFEFLGNSVLLAVLAAGVCIVAALVVANGNRFAPGPFTQAAAMTTSVGYALPGPVVAIGVLLVVAGLDQVLDGVGLGIPGLLVTGSLLALVYAYGVRFLALAYHAFDASLQRVPPQLGDVARSLGARPRRVLARINLPLTRGGLGVAAILVIVEALKELPIVLLLRPFGFDTLSVHVWQLASDSRWEAAAFPSLTIIAAAFVPVLLLFRLLSSPAGSGAAGARSSTGATPAGVR